MLLICIHGARQHITLNTRVVGHNPFAGDKGSLAHHILPCCITSGVIKAQVAHTGGSELLNIAQLARSGGGLRLGSNLGEIVFDPEAKIAGLAGIFKYKYRRPLHSIINHCDFGSARFSQQASAAIIASDQGAFTGGHGHIEITIGMLTID